jgi:hypothetical protein
VPSLLTRRNFLAIGGAAAAGLVATQISGGKKVRYRIVPLPEVDYSPGFLKLAQTKTYRSVEHVLRSVCDPELEFAIEEVAPRQIPPQNLKILGIVAAT